MSNDTKIVIYKSDGTVAVESGDYSYTLLAATTYYATFPVHGPVSSLHMLFDSASVITSVEIEDSNLPEATIHSAVVGEWIKEDPAGAEVEVVGNCAAVGAVVSKTAGAIGGAMVHLSDFGALRARAKIVVGATGGVARLAAKSKE